MNKLTGKGRPSRYLEGQVGQFYEDLDTGNIYECRQASQFSPTHRKPVGGYIWELRAKGEDIHDQIYGGGLPTGGDPYKQLVTDGSGNAVWEDRLAYKYEAEKVLLEETELDCSYMSGNSIVPQTSPYIPLVAGRKYKVIWDGEENICTCNSLVMNDVEVLHIGNMGLGNGAGQYPDTGEKFGYQLIPSYNMGMVGAAEKGEHTMMVYEYVPTAKPVDPEYLGGWKALGEKTGNVTITFNSDVTGTEHIELVPNQLYVVKLSDKVPGKDEFIGAEIDSFVPEVGVVGTNTVTSDKITETDGGYIVSNAVFVVKDHTAFVAMNDVSVTSNGIWIVYSGAPYISTIKYVGKTITLIPKEYLPEDIGGGAMRVIVTAETDETGAETYSASHTYAEIEEAFAAGKHVECVYGSRILQMGVLPGAAGMVSYAALPAAEFWCVDWDGLIWQARITASKVYFKTGTLTIT